MWDEEDQFFYDVLHLPHGGVMPLKLRSMVGLIPLFAVETLLGSARLLARRDEDPEILRNQVTSPNGVTAAGLRRMAELDFRGLVRQTVQAARARAEELSA